MTNKSFVLLSEEDKHTKFRAMVRGRTNDCLTDEELRNLTLAVSLNQQYALLIYREPVEFCRVLEIKNNNKARILFGQALLGFDNKPGALFRADQAAAAMTRACETDLEISEIHIYIPHTRKGACRNEP